MTHHQQQHQSYIIRCFGDSLTEGYSYDSRSHLTFFPYTDFIKDYIDPRILQQNKIEFPIRNYGVSGELTTDIQFRFNALKKDKKILPEKNSNEIFVFLAGTNDFGYMKTVDETFSTLYEMAFDCVNNGNRVVLCSIPAVAHNPHGWRSPAVLKRKEYSAKIKSLAEELGSDVCLFFDCHKETGVVVKDDENRSSSSSCCTGDDTTTNPPEFTKLNPQLAADNLHLTLEGYKVIAQGVSKCLDKFLMS